MTEIFNIIIGTAGHIDHGKSSLVRRLTQVDPDRLREEKERGLTIDLGFAPFVLPNGKKVGIIDVPGHEKFIKNMVAGATGIDFVVLVIAADDSVMPQTREHLEIMQLLNLRFGMIVLTKIDLVEPDLVELAVEEIREFVAGTFLENASICPVSTVTGEGFASFQETLVAAVSELSPRSSEGVFRMPIQRVFSSHGFGTIVTGIPVSGKIHIGEEIEILPQQSRGRIKKIQAYGMDVKVSHAGHSTALNAKDIDYKKVERGDVVAAPGYFHSTEFVEAELYYLKHMPRPLTHSTHIRFHTGTSETIGKVSILGNEVLEPGAKGYVQIRLASPVVVVPGDYYVIRLSSPMITIGGGVVLGIGAKKLKRFRAKVVEMMDEKAAVVDDVEKKLELTLKTASGFILNEAELFKASLLQKEAFQQLLQELVETGQVHQLKGNPPRYIHDENFAILEQRLMKAVEGFFAESSYKLFASCLTMRNQLQVETMLFDFLIERLSKEQKLKRDGDELHLIGRILKLTDEEQEMTQQLEEMFTKDEFSPPSLKDLEEQMAGDRWKNMFFLLVDKKILIKADKSIYFHHQAIAKARQLIADAIAQDGELVSGKFRDQLQTTRKYVIPLLDYFDKTGFTIRHGSSRKLAQPFSQ